MVVNDDSDHFSKTAYTEQILSQEVWVRIRNRFREDYLWHNHNI